MKTHLSVKIVAGAITLVVLVSLGFWYFLNFSPPYNVLVTDVATSSAAIVWTTSKPTEGTVYSSPDAWATSLLPLTLPLVRIGQLPQKTINHRMVLTNLVPGKPYQFAIGVGIHVYHVERFVTVHPTTLNMSVVETKPLPVVMTSARHATQPHLLDIGGIVRNSNLSAKSGALVVAQLDPGGAAYSAVTDDKGMFSLRLPPTTSARLYITARVSPSVQRTLRVLWDLAWRGVTITLP